MLISLNWLGRHLDLSGLDARRIASDLTLATAEVEGVEEFLPHARSIVVGKVLERAPHPKADRLSLCRVDVGGPEPLPIVCGAANVAQGQTVPVALPGTTLPGIGKLEKAKIRDEVSFGMICSEQEVGLADESAGIWVLPSELPPGQSLADALGIGDSVIDIDNKSLTHRPDLWGHRGIARELSAIYRRPLRPLDTTLPTLGSQPAVPVAVESPACQRYLALPIEGVEALASPLWLVLLLRAVGQRSLGQLVDISNFVMLDLGQPNHVFDRAELGPDGILVRKARRDERFTTLAAQALTLSDEDLLITSKGQGVALAGVIGGQNSEVKAGTRSLLLEVATFDATTVRRTSVRHGLRTDSSARFEKSLDPELPPLAAAHFARLLSELQPKVSFPAGVSDVRTTEAKNASIVLRPGRVREALGAEIPDTEIIDLLERLGFGVNVRHRGAESDLLVKVPSDRATKDISIERDLVEEVGRLYGYGNIAERKLICAVEPPPHDPRRWLVRAIADRLAGSAHFTETISYSFLPDELIELFGFAAEPHATLANPVVSQQSRIRRSLVPSLCANLEMNRRYRDEVRLFEIGKGYFPEHRNERHEPEERHLVGLVLAAPWRKGTALENDRRDNSLARLQAVVADVLNVVERQRVTWGPVDAPPYGQPGRVIGASYPSGTVAATLSTLRPAVLAGLGLKAGLQSDVAVAEISIDAILAAPRETRRYTPVPRFPGIKVDVAIAVAQNMPSAQVVAVIQDAAGSVCRAVDLFDIYTGEAVGSGKKSLAYHVLLQAEDKTLGEIEEQKFLKRLAGKLESIGAALRDG
jgi:phenylalanyl-tRNA synthetase beta chain